MLRFPRSAMDPGACELTNGVICCIVTRTQELEPPEESEHRTRWQTSEDNPPQNRRWGGNSATGVTIQAPRGKNAFPSFLGNRGGPQKYRTSPKVQRVIASR